MVSDSLALYTGENPAEVEPHCFGDMVYHTPPVHELVR